MKIELSHDILARKVYDTASPEEKMRLRMERFLKNRYAYYSDQGVLLGKEDLNYIQPFLKEIALSEEEEAFIRESRSHVEGQERRKKRIALAIIAGLSLLSAFAIWQWQLARYQKKQAIAQQQTADSLRFQAEDLVEQLGLTNTDLEAAKKQADENAMEARAAEADAKTNEETAIRNEKRATRAEQTAKAERDQAEKRALAYRLLVLAVEQQNQGDRIKAFQIAQKAQAVFQDEAVNNFLQNTFNKLDEKNKILSSLSGSPLLKARFLDDNRVFSVHEKEVNIWSVSDLNQRFKIIGSRISDADYRANDQAIALADENQVLLRRPPYRETERTLLHPTSIVHLAFIPGTDLLLTLAQDQQARIWSIAEEKIDRTLDQSSKILAIAVDAQGKKLAYATSKNQVKIETISGRPADNFDLEDEISTLYFSPDGRFLICQLLNYHLQVYDLYRKQIMASVAHNAPVMDVDFPKNALWFLSGSNDETAKRWSYSGLLLQDYSHYRNEESTAYVESVAIAPNGNHFLTGTYYQEVINWNLDGTPLANYQFDDRIAALDYSPSQQFFLVGQQNGTVRVYQSYSNIIAQQGGLSWIDIDRLGFEMPMAYWLGSRNPDSLKWSAEHFSRKSDNFKRPEQQVEVLTKAAHLYEKWLSLVPSSSLTTRDRESISQVYGNLAWYQLQTKAFKDALDSSKSGLRINPEKKWINSNLALAYVLTGQFDRARPIYLGLKNERYDAEERDNRKFRDVFLQDINELQNIGITHPNFGGVKSLLK